MKAAAARTTLLVCVLHACLLSAQTVTTEAVVTVGHSSEASVSAAATQLRAFGDLTHDVRFYAEAAWGKTSDDDVDAFGAAYPYRDRIQMIEAYGERMFHPHRTILGVKAGRFRTPFGISSASDQGYNGFLRPPLMRYDGYFSISNNFLEQGVDVVAGIPRLTVEIALSAPADVGTSIRPRGLDSVIRAQAYAGPVIAGVSYIRTLPYQSSFFAHGHAEFGGVDLRVTRGGLQLRGEFIDGHPFDGTRTAGWYVDALVHQPGMGPVTAVARIEDLSYQAIPPFDTHGRRQTIGARVRVIEALALQINAVHQVGQPSAYGTRALDVALTYSVRR